MAAVCPFCGNPLPSDLGDAQLVVCLGCTAHLRRAGDALEVVAPPPGEAVPSAVEREDTDRAVIAPTIEAPAASVEARVASDEPTALPPPPGGEANAPVAATNPVDDRTPAVGVPLAVRAAAPTTSATPASTTATPAPTATATARLRSPEPPRSRAVVVIVAIVAAVLLALAALLIR